MREGGREKEKKVGRKRKQPSQKVRETNWGGRESGKEDATSLLNTNFLLRFYYLVLTTSS
jgi:hypothetical protein